MTIIMILFVVFCIAVVAFVSFCFGAAWEDTKITKAAKDGNPYKFAGAEVCYYVTLTKAKKEEK